MLIPGFWDNKTESEEVIAKLNSLKKKIGDVKKLKIDVEGSLELLSEINQDEDIDLLETINDEFEKIKCIYDSFELEILLNKEYDKNNCILEIHSGAGGTEACDWANMLYRMYTRFCSAMNFKIEEISKTDGEEVGIKSVSIMVRGVNACGYLKGEKGVHRLVRLSPFDSNNKRHTSFASIDVTPEFDNVVDIDILESDLKIDVYRSSGAGGQSVNTTDSAVRITHLPTKIVVTCQNERSQIKNKDMALKILTSKLKTLEIEKQEAELNQFKGSQAAINFGSQIRSYVMHPYSMVKDHRTNEETSNVSKVMDGELIKFIYAFLKNDVN